MPRVTVGIPTYNRAASLQLAVASVLDQSHTDLELLIADNASTDETADRCAEWAARDDRVRYVRHERNLGLTANVNAILSRASGEFVMVLADDDWLDPDYVERCLAVLDSSPDVALVSGSARFHAGDEDRGEGGRVEVVDPQPGRRVREYFSIVADNVSMYGLIRREVLEPALPMRNMLAGDWLLIARVAFAGKVRTLDTTTLHRSAEGTSADIPRYVARLGLGRVQARVPHLAICWFVLADVGWSSPVYRPLGRARRLALALRCSVAVLRARRREILWDAVFPILERPAVARVYGPVRDRVRQRFGVRGG